MSTKVKILQDDILKSSAQTLVNTINCVGVMGKGIALEFKKRFPEMYVDYKDKCELGEVKLGKPYLFKREQEPWILNFPTKDHWRSFSKIDDIRRGLEYLKNNYASWGITSIAVPPLGCGHGQLEWKVVGRTLYRYLDKMNIPVELYAPFHTPEDELQLDFLTNFESEQILLAKTESQTRIKASWLALVEILHRLQKQPYSWPVGRTTFQKIAYVATRSGIPTGLEYGRGSYGPYSSGVKNIVSRLHDHDIIKEKRAGRMFQVKVGPTYSDAQRNYKIEIDKWEPILKKTADLFSRMDTRQAEIVATVLFVVDEIKKTNKLLLYDQDILESVMTWKQRRRPPLRKEDVLDTIHHLAILNWIDVECKEEVQELM